MMNKNCKSEVLSILGLKPYKTVKETKLFGVLFYIFQKAKSIELLFSNLKTSMFKLIQ